MNADANVLCVSTEATGRSGQRTEGAESNTACRTGMDDHKEVLILARTHKPDRSCKSMTGVCTGCKQWRPVLEGGDQLDHQ